MSITAIKSQTQPWFTRRQEELLASTGTQLIVLKGQMEGHCACALALRRNAEATQASGFHRTSAAYAPRDGRQLQQTVSAQRASLENILRRTHQAYARNVNQGRTGTRSDRELAKPVLKRGTLTSPRRHHAEIAPLAIGAIAQPTTISIPTAIHAVLESTSFAKNVELQAKAVASAPAVNFRTSKRGVTRAKIAPLGGTATTLPRAPQPNSTHAKRARPESTLYLRVDIFVRHARKVFTGRTPLASQVPIALNATLANPAASYTGSLRIVVRAQTAL